MTEGQRLSEIYDDIDYYDICDEIKDRNIKLQKSYSIAKSKKVNEDFNCAYCGKKHKKKQYSQAFCPPAKKGQRKISKCKDKFWNSVDDRRWRNHIQQNENYLPNTFEFE